MTYHKELKHPNILEEALLSVKISYHLGYHITALLHKTHHHQNNLNRDLSRKTRMTPPIYLCIKVLTFIRQEQPQIRDIQEN